MIEFLAANWLWIAAIVLFVAMHRSGHGCGMHGSHGSHAGHQHSEQNRPTERTETGRGTA